MSKIPLPAELNPEDARIYRRVMGRFATGITIVTTTIDNQVFGMTVNAFMAGSLEPPLCVVAIGNKSGMAARLSTTGHFGISFLREDQQWISQKFGGGPHQEREPQYRMMGEIPVLEHSLASMTATVDSTAPCGDHTLFVGRILAMAEEGGKPLLFSASRYAGVGFADAEEVAPPEFW